MNIIAKLLLKTHWRKTRSEPERLRHDLKDSVAKNEKASERLENLLRKTLETNHQGKKNGLG